MKGSCIKKKNNQAAERIMRITSFLSVFLVLFLSLSGCGSESSDSSKSASRSFMMGIAPIPASYPGTNSTWTEMFEKISSAGEIATAQNPWRDSQAKSGEIPEFIALVGNQKNTYNYEPLYGINFFTQSGTYDPILLVPTNTTDNNWGNTEAKALYRQAVLAICSTYRPKYLAIALEVNSYYFKHPADYALCRFTRRYMMK
jgi:hypothetical protein